MGEFTQVTIRTVNDDDMEAITAIYADEVLNGVSSWEELPPSQQEMTDRRDNILSTEYPYRVAELDGKILGYAYASSYRPRSGYRFAVENTIYVANNARGKGVGRMLLEDLVEGCRAKGYKQMIAVIGDSNNHPSIDFHSCMGFEQVGLIKSIGFKFGRWMDSVIMQRSLEGKDKAALAE